MKFIFSLISDSITLDFRTLLIKEWSFRRKITFILTKYGLLIKHFFNKFNLGEDFVHFDGKKIFYDSRYGLAGYQGINCSHRKLIEDFADIKDAKVILDIGANVGFFSMLCRELYPKAKIYSFEPVPKTFSCLEKNFEEDKNTEVFNYAVGDKEGTLKMSFDKGNTAVSKVNEKGEIEVRSVMLDSFCKERNIESIDILKIDTETYENFVLSGAKDILKKVRYILMEVTVENNKNYTISSLFKILSTDDYDFQILGFRNFSGNKECTINVMDVLLKNVFIGE